MEKTNTLIGIAKTLIGITKTLVALPKLSSLCFYSLILKNDTNSVFQIIAETRQLT